MRIDSTPEQLLGFPSGLEEATYAKGIEAQDGTLYGVWVHGDENTKGKVLHILKATSIENAKEKGAKLFGIDKSKVSALLATKERYNDKTKKNEDIPYAVTNLKENITTIDTEKKEMLNIIVGLINELGEGKNTTSVKKGISLLKKYGVKYTPRINENINEEVVSTIAIGPDGLPVYNQMEVGAAEELRKKGKILGWMPTASKMLLPTFLTDEQRANLAKLKQQQKTNQQTQQPQQKSEFA